MSQSQGYAAAVKTGDTVWPTLATSCGVGCKACGLLLPNITALRQHKSGDAHQAGLVASLFSLNSASLGSQQGALLTTPTMTFFDTAIDVTLLVMAHVFRFA